ncbi:hypothetical protein BU24DRAFT_446264 [Aaosphaeria arxii CBS 175.79]|uniref:CENP-V/GFA domain-containing protein n=1 Tax=Aaosphaeria arxii CBS 175.79 TaxID=1450172 RepID=A0A6A5Y7C0_9PLEO|nr:uncharacterized protein BU24DRAFT_446264 [Aaosphaeria arxii CBS 175.79]KAF2021186.1 hypothetical protein BU24DRAFT_446264 [Aaosphaeria arxii CBS 175.79]
MTSSPNPPILHISCHCTLTTHTLPLPPTLLPLKTSLCNCNISRRISGSLLTSYIDLTPPPPHNQDVHVSKPDVSALTPYRSSSILTRWFCGTCGTHMFLEYDFDGHFEAATGAVRVEGREGTDGVVRVEAVMWIGDTVDGGAGRFIKSVDGRVLRRFLEGSTDEEGGGDVPPDWTSSSRRQEVPEGKGEEAVHARCHCGGVEFWVTPPNAASREARSPYPDLLVPYNSRKSAENPGNEAWWLPGEGRYLAGTCACESCRRVSGFDVTFWAFVPTCNIFQDEACTVPFTRRPYWGSMKVYESSKGVTRTFCGTCGANVFWDGEGRDGLVDVAVGLLDAKSGARAEEILSWCTERVSFAEEALNKGLIRGLQEGLQSWGSRHDEG